MVEKASTGLVIDAELLEALNEWAQEERRSRNNLIEFILEMAVKQHTAQKAGVREVCSEMGGDGLWGN